MEKIIIIYKDVIHIIPQRDILYCRADDSYTLMHLVNGKELMVSKSLSKLCQALNNKNFIKVSQSYCVNRDYVMRIDKRKRTVVLAEAINLPYTIKVKDLLNRLRESKEQDLPIDSIVEDQNT